MKKQIVKYVQDHIREHVDEEYLSLAWKHLGMHYPLIEAVRDAVADCLQEWEQDNDLPEDSWREYFDEEEEVFWEVEL